MSDATEYEIRTIADIVAIPKKKRAAFLTDLRNWLEFNDEIPRLNAELANLYDTPEYSIRAVPDTSCMVWVDDDKNDILAEIHTVKKP